MPGDVGRFNCVVLLGPTAVGKTAIGVRLAHEFGGCIISADSRQTYRKLDIGSGKDLGEYQVDGIPVGYRLIDVADLTEEYSLFSYQRDFYRAFAELEAEGILPVVVGGTGMYLDSVIRGYSLPDVPDNPELRADLESRSLDELARIFLELKPDPHNRSDLLDRSRTIKAIEIALAARDGDRRPVPRRPDIRPLVIGTTLDRPVLWDNIARRLRERLDGGMLEEVSGIHRSGIPWERLERLGLEYRYCSLYLEGKIPSMEDLYDRLFIAIRQFAKRQETWFRGMERKGVPVRWLPRVPGKEERIAAAENMMAECGFRMSGVGC